MLSSRLLVLYEKRDLTTLLNQEMDKDEAMKVVKALRRLNMPQQFYCLIADALSSKHAVKYSEELESWNHLINAKINSLKKS